MSELDLQYSLANATPANANPVEANFNRIEQHVNQEVIRRDGVVAMQAQLKLFGNPVAPLDAVAKQFLDQLMPIGMMTYWPGSTAPPGGLWALANNALVPTADYPELFGVYGYAWGGSGGDFRLPMQPGTMPITPGGTLAGTVGQTGGNKDGAVVAHTHPIGHTHTASTTGDQDRTHTHDLGSHTHRGTTLGGGAHSHGLGEAQLYYVGSLGLEFSGSGGSAARSGFFTAALDHTHGFTTGIPEGNMSGNTNQGHLHPIPALAHTGASGAASGEVAATNTNLPPYAVVNMIVRVH